MINASGLMEEPIGLVEQAKAVLEANSLADYTMPAENPLPPPVVVGIAAFIAIGPVSLRHCARLKKNFLALLRGQWAKRMLPHMIFARGQDHYRDRQIWRSESSTRCLRMAWPPAAYPAAYAGRSGGACWPKA